MDPAPSHLSDGQLVIAVRDGVDAAWSELEARHGAAALAVATARFGLQGRSRTRIGLDRLRSDVRHDTPLPVDEYNRGVRSFRARVLRAVTDGDLLVDGDEGSAHDASDEMSAASGWAAAFASLPEPWQAALWHALIERQSADQVASIVGRSPDNTRLLVDRASTDLADAFVVQRHSRGEATEDRKALLASLPVALPRALVPPLTGLTVADYRAAVGVEHPVDDQEHVDEHVEHDPVAADEHVVDARVGAGASTVATFESGGTTTDEPPIARVPQQTPRVAGDRGPVDASLGSITRTAPSRPETGPVRSAVMIVLLAVVAIGLVGAAIAVLDAIRQRDADGVGAADPHVVEDLLAADDRRINAGEPNRNVVGLTLVTDAADEVPGDVVDVTVDVPGPVFASGTATVSVRLTTAEPEPATATLQIDVPAEVAFEGVIDGDADCLRAADATTSCAVTIPPGESTALLLRFSLDDTAHGRFVVDAGHGEAVDVPIERV